MEEKMVLDFFPDSTLKGSQFYFYCPNMNQKDKVSISKLIKDYEGVISYLNKIIFNLNIVNIIHYKPKYNNHSRNRNYNNFQDFYENDQ